MAATLSGTPGPDEPKALAAARWLTESDAVAEVPVGDARAQLGANVQAAISGPLDWAAFRAGGLNTANRIGLLVCGNPLDALRVLARSDNFIATAPDDDERVQARRGFLRTTAVRELVRYLLSDAYEQALAPPAPPAT